MRLFERVPEVGAKGGFWQILLFAFGFVGPFVRSAARKLFNKRQSKSAPGGENTIVMAELSCLFPPLEPFGYLCPFDLKQ